MKGERSSSGRSWGELFPTFETNSWTTEAYGGLALKSKHLVSHPNFYDLNKCREIAYLWIIKLYIVKMAMLPKFLPRFNTIQIKISISILIKIDKLILRFAWKFKEPRIAKVIWTKNIVEGLILFDFSTYYKAIVIPSV